jgi:ATP-binding cassette, subfamily C (CFTR/MRP), member 1
MLKTFFPELAMAFFPRLCLMGLSLAQPYLVKASILYITFHAIRPDNYGYGLIGAYALTYLGIAVGSPSEKGIRLIRGGAH